MIYSHSSNSFYRRKSVFSRDFETPVSYSSANWVDLYDSGALDYDSEIVEFGISITLGTPVNPKHRILVIPKGFQATANPTVAYPYNTALTSSDGEVTVSGDTVGPFPTIQIPQGASFIVQIFADTDGGGSQAQLDFVEVLQQR